MVEKNKVIENHLHRIDHMDQLAEKTYIAVASIKPDIIWTKEC